MSGREVMEQSSTKIDAHFLITPLRFSLPSAAKCSFEGRFSNGFTLLITP